jgi:hypothetical protein
MFSSLKRLLLNNEVHIRCLGLLPLSNNFQPPNQVSIISHYSVKYSSLKFLGSLFSDFRRSVKFKHSKYPAIITLL